MCSPTFDLGAIFMKYNCQRRRALHSTIPRWYANWFSSQLGIQFWDFKQRTELTCNQNSRDTVKKACSNHNFPTQEHLQVFKLRPKTV